MTTLLNFQLAGATNGYLLERLIEESVGAQRGGAIFAWANVNGVRSLLEDKVFDTFLRRRDFALVIGTDTITNPPAIKRLITLVGKRKHLSVQAYLSADPRSPLFHPKLAWFEHDSHLSLLVGSGNMTGGGLRSNWEAFVHLRLVGAERTAALEQIDVMLAALAPGLRAINDAEVLARSEKNIGDERAQRRPPVTGPLVPAATPADEVLVAEIPGSGPRGSQANFTRKIYEGFFGAKAGSKRSIALYAVDRSGDSGELESRQSVESKSKNWRFELAALRKRPNPAERPPLGVFLRLRGTREFLYVVLLEGDDGYAQLDHLLPGEWQRKKGGRRRRKTFAVDEVRAAWPDSPLWQAALPDL